MKFEEQCHRSEVLDQMSITAQPAPKVVFLIAFLCQAEKTTEEGSFFGDKPN